MKKIITGVTLALASMHAMADDPFLASGSNLTYGGTSGRTSVLSAINNPAAAGNFVGTGQRQYRFGLLSATGFGMEVGQVDNFYDEVKDLADRLDVDDISATEAIDIADEFNAILPEVGAEGYVNIGGAAHLPGFPLSINHSAIGGAITLDMSVASESHIGLLDAPIVVNPLTDEAQTGSSLYAKSSVTQEFSVGYSRPVFNNGNGNLLAGVRGKVMRVGLVKNAIPVDEMQDDNSDVGAYFSDDFSDQANYSTGMGLDAGLLWSAKYYQLGATVQNLISPSFEYNQIGTGCAALTGFEQSRCFNAQTFANEIDLNETYTLDPQLKLESAVFTANRQYSAGIALDASSVRDPVAEERQWLNVSIGATPWWGVTLRGGYRANLVGNQLKAITTGTTLFKAFNFDLAYGLDSVEIEGTTVPRSVAANMGLELVF